MAPDRPVALRPGTKRPFGPLRPQHRQTDHAGCPWSTPGGSAARTRPSLRPRGLRGLAPGPGLPGSAGACPHSRRSDTCLPSSRRAERKSPRGRALRRRFTPCGGVLAASRGLPGGSPGCTWEGRCSKGATDRRVHLGRPYVLDGQSRGSRWAAFLVDSSKQHQLSYGKDHQKGRGRSHAPRLSAYLHYPTTRPRGGPFDGSKTGRSCVHFDNDDLRQARRRSLEGGRSPPRGPGYGAGPGHRLDFCSHFRQSVSHECVDNHVGNHIKSL